MKLYDLELSGNCYKIRLFCSLIEQPLEIRPVDYLGGEHLGDDYLKLNPLGKIPLLDDDGILIRDSQAILIYLANKFEATRWWPISAKEQAEVSQWLSVAANEIARGPNDARLHDQFSVALDVGLARENADYILSIINNHLENNIWLATDNPTIAEIACFPYIALAEEGGVSLLPYKNINQRMLRIKALPAFITMPGISG